MLFSIDPGGSIRDEPYMADWIGVMMSCPAISMEKAKGKG